MNDLLTWIASNQGPAFGLAFFILVLAGILTTNLASFITNLARAFTGKYPPARPVVQCDGNCKRDEVCRCCEEGCDDEHCDCQNV